MAIPWTAIAQVASSAIPAISKLFGGGDKSSGRIDLKQLVKDAERAGFNPLTVLRNGGAAGYQQTHHPAFSTAEVVGEALGGIANTIAGFDPHAEAKRTMERDLAQAQIANLQADTAARNRASIGGVPTWTGSPKNLYEPWIDNSPSGGGKTVFLVNADAPDAEQIIMPSLATEKPGFAVTVKPPEVPGTPLSTGPTWNDLTKAWTDWSKPWREPLFP